MHWFKVLIAFCLDRRSDQLPKAKGGHEKARQRFSNTASVGAIPCLDTPRPPRSPQATSKAVATTIQNAKCVGVLVLLA